MKVRKKTYILMLSVLGIVCVVLFAIERVTEQCVLIRIVNMNLYDFLFVFMCLIGVGANSLLVRYWRKTTYKFYKGLLVLGWVLLVGVLMAGSLIWLANHAVTTWYEFYSPNHKHSVVVRESTLLLLSDIRPYERTSPILVRELEVDLSTDDGFPSISRGDYKVFWNRDVVTLDVYTNYNGAWDKVKLDMADHGKVLEVSTYYPDGKPEWLDRKDDKNKNDLLVPLSDDSELEDIQEEQIDQKILDGIQAVALTTGYVTKRDLEITYTAKGTPELVLSSDLNTNKYILYDRNSSNGKCALYVLYQSKNNGEESSKSEILEMYAYEYSSGKVIKANRHAWSDVGTDEYREATGE